MKSPVMTTGQASKSPSHTFMLIQDMDYYSLCDEKTIWTLFRLFGGYY